MSDSRPAVPKTESIPNLPRPFRLSIRSADQKHDGPVDSGAVLLTSALRTSGFLHALPPEDLKTLIFLLTLLKPDGQCELTLHELAAAMRVSIVRTESRME